MDTRNAEPNLHAITSKPFTFVDIFAGCGGLSLGLMQAGLKGIFAVEHDTNAFQTLHHNLISPAGRHHFLWPEWLPKAATGALELLEGKSEELSALAGKVDILVGGPPCQGFSAAGKRNPSDPRNRLVEAYLEFVKIIKPRVVLIENVRGITADFSDTHETGGKINYASWITETLSAGYVVSTKTLDTSEFGVPQRRHRYFVIALQKHIAEAGLNPFDIIENCRHAFLKRKGIMTVPVSAKMAISDFEIGRNGKIPSRDSKGFEDIHYIGPITNYQSIMNSGSFGLPTDTRVARHRPEIANRFRRIIDLCHADGRLNVSLSSELRASFGLKKCAIRVLDPNSPSPTVTSMPDDLIHYSEPRTLTVRENARLQSFPDWFAFKGKYTTGGDRRKREVPRFTQVANAVPPLVAECIGLAISKILAANDQVLTLPSPAEQSIE